MRKVANCTFRRLILIEKRQAVVLFSSDLCPHCDVVKPILRKIMKKTENIEFIELDYIKDENLARQYSVMFLPTVITFKDGRVMSMIEGLKKEQRYKNKIGEIC